MGDVNYLGLTPLGKIQRWQDSKAATITPISFPGKDSGKTEGIDTLGVIAYINIEGRFTGKFQDIQSYIYAIKGIADGYQLASTVIYSPFVNATDYTGTLRAGSMGTTTSVVSNKCIDTSATFIVNGIKVGDIVKNLSTGSTALVTSIDLNSMVTLNTDIFTATGQSYAITANINVKVLSFEAVWELPGLSFCNYTLSLIQVA